jgi:hypothetical protein
MGLICTLSDAAKMSTKHCLRLQVGLSPAHGLMGVAGEDGRLECFDPRQRAAVGVLDAAAAAGAVSRPASVTMID